MTIHLRAWSKVPDGCGPEGRPARIHRERDFGVGYGNSSGYASNRTYSTPQNNYFRCR